MRSRRVLAVAAAAVFVAGALSAGCGPSEERASDEQLRAALERLRTDTKASAPQRRLELIEVERCDARTTAGVEAKSACGDAYRKLFDAEDAVEKVELSMKTEKAMGYGPTPAVLQELAFADRLLESARLAMPACDAAAAKLALAAR